MVLAPQKSRMAVGSEEAYTWWALGSLIACVLFFFIYTWFPMTRRPPSPIIWFVCLCETGLALAFILDSAGSACTTVVALSQFCEFASQAWRFLVFVDIVMIVRNPYDPGRHRNKYHMVAPPLTQTRLSAPAQVVWPAALALSIMTRMYSDLDRDNRDSDFCIILPTELHNNGLAWLLMYASSAVFAVSAVGLVLYVHRTLGKPEYRLLRKRCEHRSCC